jgi:hypothetical protein
VSSDDPNEDGDSPAPPATDGDTPDPPRWAADEPTAVWDESLMKDAGYDELAEHRSAAPRAESGPATGREVGGDRNVGVQVSKELTGGHPAQPGPVKKSGGGLSWALTLAVAVALGVAVYFLVRFLR